MIGQNKAKAESTPIDEVELALGMLKIDKPELVEGRTYKEISDSLNKLYSISSTEDDIFLLHEPTISEIELDLRIQFEALGLVY